MAWTPDEITVKFTLRSGLGMKPYWEVDVDADYGHIGGGTSPCFWGAFDLAGEVLEAVPDIDILDRKAA